MFRRRSLLLGVLALTLVACSDPGGTDWYRDADADGWGTDETTLRAVARPTGYVAIPGDCDDSDPTVYPGAPELLDGIDNDCNGIIDDIVSAGDAAEIDLVVLLTVDDVLRVQVIEHGRPRALRTNTSETAVHRVRERARGRLYRRS